MKRELKIITGPTVHDTRVLVDDEPIGLIQDIKFEANVEHTTPLIQITFPDFRQHRETNASMAKTLDHYLDMLKEFPYVQVVLRRIW
jgi:hypothetical protein